jgi:hypothetical protein
MPGLMNLVIVAPHEKERIGISPNVDHHDWGGHALFFEPLDVRWRISVGEASETG